MKIRLLNLVCIVCMILLTPLLVVNGQSDSVKHSSSIMEYAHRLLWLNHKRELARFRFVAHGYSDSLAKYDGLYRAMLVESDVISTGSESTDNLDVEERRIIELLKPLIDIRSIEETGKITALRDSLSQLFGNWSPSDVMNSEVQSIGTYGSFVNETNSGKRETVLREICAPGDEISDLVSKLFSERNRLARLAGYDNYYNLIVSSSGQTLEEVRKLLNEIEQSGESNYQNIIRNMTKDASPELWDIGRPAARLNRDYINLFPPDSHLIVMKKTLLDIGFNIDVLPIYIDKKSEQDKIFFIDPPYDIRLMVTQSEHLTSFKSVATLLAHSLAASQVDEGRGIFSSIDDDIWHVATGQILVRLCASRQWLSRNTTMTSAAIRKFVKDGQVVDNLMARFRLMEVHFEGEAYLNPNQDLSKLYWSLCKQYLGVAVHDDIDAFKLSYNIFISPLSAYVNLVGEMAAAQMVAHLSTRFTDATMNTGTSSFLTQNYYRFGSRYRWQELLLRGTDEDLNPAYLIKSNQ